MLLSLDSEIGGVSRISLFPPHGGGLGLCLPEVEDVPFVLAVGNSGKSGFGNFRRVGGGFLLGVGYLGQKTKDKEAKEGFDHGRNIVDPSSGPQLKVMP